jgi:hypothetical protein
MKVMVIPEDPTLDQYILKPVVEHLFEDLNRPARVAVLKDPHLRGVSQALDKEILSLIVDRDCESRRQTQLDARIAEAASRGKILIGCLAIEEVEAWALALHREELSDGWREVRRECHPKDRYFDPLARRKKWRQALGRGRVEAMRALRGNWRAIKNLCPELEDLRARIADRLQDLNS